MGGPQGVSMSNALTVYAPQDLAQSQEVAETLAHSGLVPDALKGKPAAVWAILALGAELGLPGPMAALSGLLAAESLMASRASMPRFRPAATVGGISTA
jgi:hypothetical protein